MLLADAAPTGTGLAIVGVVLLVMLAIAILAVFFLVKFAISLWRRSHPKPIA